MVTMMVYYSDLIGDSALSRAFDQKGNHMAKYLVSAGALIGLTGTTIVSLMPMPRLLYSMANDGLIFRWLASVNERTETPVIATIITGFLTGMPFFWFSQTPFRHSKVVQTFTVSDLITL